MLQEQISQEGSTTVRTLIGGTVSRLLALIVALSPVLVLAQQSSVSNIVGHVTDSTGALVAGATVHIVNQATAAERTAVTNNAGDFSIPDLPPATYQLNVEKAGFKTTTIPTLELLVGEDADENITLSVGSANETVQVTSLTPQLQTSDAAVGQVIDQKQITDLPLNGRSVLQLATLAAGVSPAQFANTGTPGQFGTRSLYITVDGAAHRPASHRISFLGYGRFRLVYLRHLCSAAAQPGSGPHEWKDFQPHPHPLV